MLYKAKYRVVKLTSPYNIACFYSLTIVGVPQLLLLKNKLSGLNIKMIDKNTKSKKRKTYESERCHRSPTGFEFARSGDAMTFAFNLHVSFQKLKRKIN